MTKRQRHDIGKAAIERMNVTPQRSGSVDPEDVQKASDELPDARKIIRLLTAMIRILIAYLTI